MASGSWFLQAISILPECRGQGHANALLTKAEEVAKKSGTKKITLQVKEFNPIALKTFTNNGYLELSRRKFITFSFSDETGDIMLTEKDL